MDVVRIKFIRDLQYQSGRKQSDPVLDKQAMKMA